MGTVAGLPIGRLILIILYYVIRKVSSCQCIHVVRVDYMRHFYLLGLILASLSSTLAALHKSDVGIVDWHQPYLGVPLTSLSTAPTFHNKLGRPPILLTATRSNVLAALHASNGSLGKCQLFPAPPKRLTSLIAWRFIFEPDDVIVHYQRHGDG